jgi:uncharacterized protein (TIGR03086 family)
MSENLRHYTKAVYALDHVLKSATAKTPIDKVLAKKAPCTGWTGKDVYEHCVGNLAMIKSFATTGKGPKSTPRAGTDPMGAWEKLRDVTLATLDHPGVLQTVAHDPFGPEFGSMPVDNLVGFMAAELAVHVWDMARTAKVDERIDAGLAKYSLATWKTVPEEALRMPGFCAAAIKPASGSDVQTKLLNFMGRAV